VVGWVARLISQPNGSFSAALAPVGGSGLLAGAAVV
jgi:hypothetical protein